MEADRRADACRRNGAGRRRGLVAPRRRRGCATAPLALSGAKRWRRAARGTAGARRCTGHPAADEHGHARDRGADRRCAARSRAKMQALAADALQKNQASFLNLAERGLRQAPRGRGGQPRTAAEGHRRAARPDHADAWRNTRPDLREIEKARAAAYGGLVGGDEGARPDAGRRQRADPQAGQRAAGGAQDPRPLGRAAAPQRDGAVGDVALYAISSTEQTIAYDDGRLRPDVIIRLPGERRIVVDAKTSMAAYLDAVEAVDDDVREAHLVAARAAAAHPYAPAGRQGLLGRAAVHPGFRRDVHPRREFLRRGDRARPAAVRGRDRRARC